jgi:hypothetical protein
MSKFVKRQIKILKRINIKYEKLNTRDENLGI